MKLHQPINLLVVILHKLSHQSVPGITLDVPEQGSKDGAHVFLVLHGAAPHPLPGPLGVLHEHREEAPQSVHLHKLCTVLCPLVPAHGVVEHLQSAAMGTALLLQHQDHQLEPLPLQEPVPVRREHERGAEAIKEVLHHLHLVQAARVPALVVRQGLQEDINAVLLSQETLVGLVALEEDGEDLCGVELVGVVRACTYPLEEPGEEPLLPRTQAHLGTLELCHVLDYG